MTHIAHDLLRVTQHPQAVPDLALLLSFVHRVSLMEDPDL